MDRLGGADQLLANLKQHCEDILDETPWRDSDDTGQGVNLTFLITHLEAEYD